MRLGGLRINPTTNISSSVTYINIKLRKIKEKRNSGKRFTRKSKITNLSWSPNEKKIAFQILQKSLWVVDVASAQAKQLTDYTVMLI
jgi:hypothetical protein